MNQGTRWVLLMEKIDVKVSWKCIFKGIFSQDIDGVQVMRIDKS
jgi:hypothetical protein